MDNNAVFIKEKGGLDGMSDPDETKVGSSSSLKIISGVDTNNVSLEVEMVDELNNPIQSTCNEEGLASHSSPPPNNSSSSSSGGDDGVDVDLDLDGESKLGCEIGESKSLEDSDDDGSVMQIDIETQSKIKALFNDHVTTMVRTLPKPAKPAKERATIVREDYGLDIKKLRTWTNESNTLMLQREDVKQEVAVQRMKKFMDAIVEANRIQSWWRMLNVRWTFRRWREERNEIRNLFFRAWKNEWLSEKMRIRVIGGTVFQAWAEEMREKKRLSELAIKFFQISIKRSRLSAQAVMAYFNPEDYMKNIEESDLNKIRGLILRKLFKSWVFEIRELKHLRFRAGQTLSRAMRRTNGPMWAKEITLLTFHMWRRYSAVRRAYKQEEPVPRFTLPFLAQWPKLLQSVALKEARKKRAADNVVMLLLLRQFRTWKYVMTLPRGAMLTPEEIAINHFNNRLVKVSYEAWSGYLQERGTVVRRRNKCFDAWAKFAPNVRRLRDSFQKTQAWIKRRCKMKAMRIMILCLSKVIDLRTKGLNVMRIQAFDRKVMSAMFAFLGHDAHVIFLDCWRRWRIWIRNKRRWKAAVWSYRVLWVDIRARAILRAWRHITIQAKDRQRHIDDVLETPKFSPNRRNTDDAKPVSPSKGLPKQASSSSVSSSTPMQLAISGKGNTSAIFLDLDEEMEEDESGLGDFMDPFMAEGLSTMQSAQSDHLSHKPSKRAFDLLCRTLAWRAEAFSLGIDDPDGSKEERDKRKLADSLLFPSRESKDDDSKSPKKSEDDEINRGVSALRHSNNPF